MVVGIVNSVVEWEEDEVVVVVVGE